MESSASDGVRFNVGGIHSTLTHVLGSSALKHMFACIAVRRHQWVGAVGITTTGILHRVQYRDFPSFSPASSVRHEQPAFTHKHRSPCWHPYISFLFVNATDNANAGTEWMRRIDSKVETLAHSPLMFALSYVLGLAGSL